MHSVNIQFHMTFPELVAFINTIRHKYTLDVELEVFYPKQTSLVKMSEDLMLALQRFDVVDRFWLCFTPSGASKPEKFMLNFGGQRGRRLAESQLGAGTAKAAAFRVLKQIASDLRRATLPGLWVTGANGSVGFSKSSRASAGACEQARDGTLELVSPAFTQLFTPDPPPE